MHIDESATRLRYNTETGEGTSGAPCFNQRFEMVGLHNAQFKPDGAVTVANQAVQLSCILPLLKTSEADAPVTNTPNLPPPPSVWNVSLDPDELRVVFGRQILLSWIELAAKTTVSQSERVYAARCRAGFAGTKGFGKSFSFEILRAARRNTGDPIVVLGTGYELLPATVPDIIRAITDQLGVGPESLTGMPPRPTEWPAGPNSSDKLLRWAIEEVPLWFNEVLAARRQVIVDEVAEAKEEVDFLKRGARSVPADLQALASSPVPKIVSRTRWDVVWIVIDSLAEVRLSVEVSDLFAALVGAYREEDATPHELRRLRWLFLGDIPEFLPPASVTSEMLDPMEIGAESFVATMRALAASVDRPLDSKAVESIGVLFDALSGSVGGFPALSDPNERLPALQLLFPRVVEVLKDLKEV